jgi:hypothetical protein
MGIIRPAHARNDDLEIVGTGFDESLVPFVPAWDLFEKAQARLTDEEAAVVGCALFLLTADPNEQLTAWNIQGRLESIAQRF